MTINPNDVNIVYSPGNWDVTATRAKTINEGAYLRLMIGGAPTAVTLNFDTTGVTSLPDIAYRVDGQGWTRVPLAASVPLTLDTKAWGQRVIEVVFCASALVTDRWTAQSVAAKLTSITTTPTSATTVQIPRRKLTGIAFGDSITAGLRTLSTTASDKAGADGTLGYAFRLQETLGAEVGVVGFGGSGLLVTSPENVPPFPQTVGTLWGSGPVRNFAGLNVDFVTINHGTNDAGTNPADVNVATALAAALNTILLATPDTTKVFIIRPFGGYEASALQMGIAACFAPYRVSYVDTTGWFNGSDSGDGLHPYGYADLQLSVLLANALRDQLTARTTYVRLPSGQVVPTD